MEDDLSNYPGVKRVDATNNGRSSIAIALIVFIVIWIVVAIFLYRSRRNKEDEPINRFRLVVDSFFIALTIAIVLWIFTIFLLTACIGYLELRR